MGIKEFLLSPQTGWVVLGLFVAGLYGFAVRMTHRNATGGQRPRTKTGEYTRVGMERGSERRATTELRPVTDAGRRSTVETRPLGDGRRSTVELRPLTDHGRRPTTELRPVGDPRRATAEQRPVAPRRGTDKG
jgi:hypothetical protein